MNFTIYTQPRCSWCKKVIELLIDHGYELTITQLEGVQKQFFIEQGMTTVPQVFFVGKEGQTGHIGGYENVVEWLEKNHVKA